MAEMELNGKTVVFAQVTGEGRKGKSKNFEYVVGLEYTKAEMKEFLAGIEEQWQEGKDAKSKKPEHDPEKWFKQDEENKKAYVLWLSETVEKFDDNLFADEDSGFTMKHFKNMGKGSVVNVIAHSFVWSNENGNGISLKLNGLKLLEYKKFDGAGDPGKKLGGKKVGGMASESKSSDDEGKKKKKKKEKKGKSKD